MTWFIYDTLIFKLTKLIENNTQKIDQVLKVAQDSLGLDLKSLIAGFAANKIIQDNKKKSDE